MKKSEELRLASEIFWSLVGRDGPFPPSDTKIKTRCWEWIGSVTKEGYGRFKFNHRTYYARRFAWTLSHGEPEGVLVIDRCGNRNCVRHLGTRLRTENLVEAALVNRYGAHHANAKLTDQKVRQIRAARAAGTPLGCAGAEVQDVACGHQQGSEPTHLEAHLTLVTWVITSIFNFLKEPRTDSARRR
jgi:hypothetical protein